ncbi:MAG: hypothetical protein M1837_000419 [Sclerophora amabilis]|nr:MAG: hypothetical protein M1837_000419 [Sclerophora amabilis]
MTQRPMIRTAPFDNDRKHQVQAEQEKQGQKEDLLNLHPAYAAPQASGQSDDSAIYWKADDDHDPALARADNLTIGEASSESVLEHFAGLVSQWFRDFSGDDWESPASSKVFWGDRYYQASDQERSRDRVVVYHESDAKNHDGKGLPTHWEMDERDDAGIHIQVPDAFYQKIKDGRRERASVTFESGGPTWRGGYFIVPYVWEEPDAPTETADTRQSEGDSDSEKERRALAARALGVRTSQGPVPATEKVKAISKRQVSELELIEMESVHLGVKFSSSLVVLEELSRKMRAAEESGHIMALEQLRRQYLERIAVSQELLRKKLAVLQELVRKRRAVSEKEQEIGQGPDAPTETADTRQNEGDSDSKTERRALAARAAPDVEISQDQASVTEEGLESAAEKTTTISKRWSAESTISTAYRDAIRQAHIVVERELQRRRAFAALARERMQRAREQLEDRERQQDPERQEAAARIYWEEDNGHEWSGPSLVEAIPDEERILLANVVFDYFRTTPLAWPGAIGEWPAPETFVATVRVFYEVEPRPYYTPQNWKMDQVDAENRRKEVPAYLREKLSSGGMQGTATWKIYDPATNADVTWRAGCLLVGNDGFDGI